MTVILKYARIDRDAALTDRQIKLVISDETVDRVGDVMVAKGCDIAEYLGNPIVLAQHDPHKPIGRGTIEIKADRVELLVEFPPAGVSQLADEYCGLAKAGVINAGSVGFDPVESEPRKGGGWRYLRWKLMETSLVSVPANPNATIIARDAAAAAASAAAKKADKHEWKVGASRNLPLGEDKAWDGPAAEARIFEACGFDGDKPDTGKARKAFLVYDAANPSLKGSYKLPFADVVDGRFTAMPAGIRAAASRLPQADIPDDVQTKARAVVDHYESKMKDADADKSGTPRVKAWPPRGKGLYDVAQLAYLLMELGYVRNNAAWEAELEGDGSKLPEMLAAALKQLAAAFLAMSSEEVGEMLAGHGIELDAGDLIALAGAPERTKVFRACLRKAGRVLSRANQEHLDGIVKCLKAIDDCHVKAADLHDDLHDTLVEMMDHGTSLGEHAKAMQKNAAGDDDDDDAKKPGESDEDPDTELAFEVARRKRIVDTLAI
jgi:HK97 family phage prohead protease